MVRVRWLFIMMIGVGLGAARADIGDVSRIVHPGEFSAHFGAAFVTGRTRDGHSQTDFSPLPVPCCTSQTHQSHW